jgi:hypothetical protein
VAAVAFVSSQTSQGAATTTPTLTLPAGVAAGDVLIAELTLFLNASDTTITTASGWTQIASNINGTAIRQALYWRLATGGDANPAFTLTASKAYSGGVSRWTGVDTIRAFTTGAGTASNGTTPTSPTLTIEQPGVTYLHFVGRNSNTVATTAPTNFTTRYAINNASAQVQSYMASRAFAATTGASGTVQSTGDGGANYVVQGLLLYSTDYATFRANSAVVSGTGVTSLTVAKPAGAVNNDEIICWMQISQTSGVGVTAPDSTWFQGATISRGTTFQLISFYHLHGVAGGTDPSGGYVFTFSGLTGTVRAFAVAYYRANTSFPVDTTASADNGASVTAASISLTTVWTFTTLVICPMQNVTTDTATPPANGFERVDSNGMEVYDRCLTGAGASGTLTATFSAAAATVTGAIVLRSLVSVLPPSSLIMPMPPRQLLPLIAR